MVKEIKKDLDMTVEDLSREIPFKETSEIGEVFKNLDDDTEDAVTKMSNIDFNARLTSMDISNITIIDELISLGILPIEVRITRQKKRLSVSLEGKGRAEKVEIASASRGADLSGRSGGIFSNLFKPRQ